MTGSDKKETIMNTIIRSALVALVLSSASAAMAAPVRSTDFVDTARPASSYNLNDPKEVRAFWDHQGRSGN
jgi:hypothetical protein